MGLAQCRHSKRVTVAGDPTAAVVAAGVTGSCIPGAGPVVGGHAVLERHQRGRICSVVGRVQQGYIPRTAVRGTGHEAISLLSIQIMALGNTEQRSPAYAAVPHPVQTQGGMRTSGAQWLSTGVHDGGSPRQDERP